MSKLSEFMGRTKGASHGQYFLDVCDRHACNFCRWFGRVQKEPVSRPLEDGFGLVILGVSFTAKSTGSEGGEIVMKDGRERAGAWR
jgi:hypothetical protein